MTAVTASPTAAERVPRPPCTTTRKVASGCAVAASSRLCGTVGLLAGRVPACAVVAPAPAVAMSVSATTSVPTSAAIRGNSGRFNVLVAPGHAHERTAQHRLAPCLHTVTSPSCARSVFSGLDPRVAAHERRTLHTVCGSRWCYIPRWSERASIESMLGVTTQAASSSASADAGGVAGSIASRGRRRSAQLGRPTSSGRTARARQASRMLRMTIASRNTAVAMVGRRCRRA